MVKCMNEVKLNQIFVYGTLMSGFGNNNLIKKSKNSIFLGKALTVEKFNMYSLGSFPAVLPVKHEKYATQIHGEIWAIDDETLKDVDRLESHPNWYKREKIKVISKENGYTRQVESYIMQDKKYHDFDLGNIKNGDFREYWFNNKVPNKQSIY